METGIIFIHGAGLGAWIWEDMQRHIRLPNLAVDFPNRGGGDKANRGIPLAEYTGHVMKQVQSLDAGKIVLVSHSIGGVVALQAAEKLGDRLESLVFVGAAVPANGGSYLSCLPLPMRILLIALMKAGGTRPPRSAIENGLCGGLTGIQKRAVLDRFTPESLKLYAENTDTGVPPVPTTYIKLTEDKELAPGIQDLSIGNLKPSKVVELPSGHLAMLAMPERLADEINAATVR